MVAVAGHADGNIPDEGLSSEIRVVLRDELDRQLEQYKEIMGQLLAHAVQTDAAVQNRSSSNFSDSGPPPPRPFLETPSEQTEHLLPTCITPIAEDAAVPQNQFPALPGGSRVLRFSEVPERVGGQSGRFLGSTRSPSWQPKHRPSRKSLDAEDRARREAAEKAHGKGGEVTEDDGTGQDHHNLPLSVFPATEPDPKDSRLQQLVSSNYFELFFAVAIITNSVWVGFTVEYTSTRPSSPVPLLFYIISHIYAYIFFVELVLRLLSEGLPMFVNDQWYWNCLDLLIVTTSMCEVVFDIISLTQDSDVDGIENMSSMRIVRIIRITRLIRIFRITRIVKFIRALRTLVYSILCTLKSLIWAMLLLLLIVYVFGILFTQSTSDYLVGKGIYVDVQSPEWVPPDDIVAMQRYWGSLLISMFTLFKAIAGGLSWQDATDCLELTGHATVMIFIFFIAFAYFAVLNVVTGVFCQSAIESTQHDQQVVVQNVISNKKQYVEKIKELFNCIDVNADGSITLKEFEAHLKDDRVIAYFDALELEVTDAWTLFKLLDKDKTNGIDIEEFVMGCVRLKGNARGIDMAKLLHENQWMSKRITTFMAETEMHFETMGAVLDRFIESKNELAAMGSMLDRIIANKNLLASPSCHPPFAAPPFSSNARVPGSNSSDSWTNRTADMDNFMEWIETNGEAEIHTPRSAWSAKDPIGTGQKLKTRPSR